MPTTVLMKSSGSTIGEGVDAERAQPHEAELRVLEGDGILRAPFLVDEHLPVDEEDLRPERALESPREREDLREDREVLRDERVAAGPEDVEPLAVLEEDRGLVVADDELRADLDLGGTLGGNAVNDLFARKIEPFQQFHELRHASLPSKASYLFILQ